MVVGGLSEVQWELLGGSRLIDHPALLYMSAGSAVAGSTDTNRRAHRVSVLRTVSRGDEGRVTDEAEIVARDHLTIELLDSLEARIAVEKARVYTRRQVAGGTVALPLGVGIDGVAGDEKARATRVDEDPL